MIILKGLLKGLCSKCSLQKCIYQSKIFNLGFPFVSVPQAYLPLLLSAKVTVVALKKVTLCHIF